MSDNREAIKHELRGCVAPKTRTPRELVLDLLRGTKPTWLVNREEIQAAIAWVESHHPDQLTIHEWYLNQSKERRGP